MTLGKILLKTRDLELFGSLSDGPLALLELLSCLWTGLPGQNVLQLHIQLLLFLSGETSRFYKWRRLRVKMSNERV